MKQYKIRKAVLNLTVDQWATYKDIARDADTMTISVKTALKNFGTMGILSAKANSDELEFIELLYKEFRKR